MKAIRTLIADDHALVRAGIRALVEKIKGITVVAEAGKGSEAIKFVSELKPDLVLLDEPFAAVDGLTRRQLRTDLRQLQERTGVPMLLVTHDLADVQELATYVAICERGNVVQDGPLDQVLAAPSNPAVAALLEAAGGRT